MTDETKHLHEAPKKGFWDGLSQTWDRNTQKIADGFFFTAGALGALYVAMLIVHDYMLGFFQ